MTTAAIVTEPHPAPAPAAVPADRSRWIALGVPCVGMLMIVLDATVVTVTLPALPCRTRHR
jgi:hypothetical protein